MPKIEADPNVVTHINVFTVRPEDQTRLVELLVATVQTASDVPGWISASVHRSFDGKQVVNYVQFESHDAARAVLTALAEAGHLRTNTALGRVASGQYEVVYALERSGASTVNLDPRE